MAPLSKCTYRLAMPISRALTPRLVVLALVTTALMVLGGTSASAEVFVPSVADPSWRVNGTVFSVATVGDRVYVGGSFTTATGSSGQTAPRANLAAFSVDTGELLTDWRADTAGAVVSMAADQNSLWIGGSFTRVGTQAHNRIAKVSLATGAPDAAFTANANNNVRALDVAGSALYVGGVFTTMNGSAATRLAKLDASTGARDLAFTASADGQVNGVKKNPVTAVLYVAGDFTQLTGVARSGIGAVNAETGASTGPAFGSSARPYLGVETNDDGTRVFGAGGGGTNSAVAWNSVNGVRAWRQVADGDIQAVRYFNGMLYFGFHDGFQGNTQIKLLAADAGSGLIDENFRPTFDGFWGVYSIAVSGKGVMAGGTFTNVGGVPAQGWVRFRNQGAPPPPPPPTVRYVGSETPWSFWDRGTRPAGWESPTFDSSSWPTGTAQLGFGDNDETTVISYGPSASAKYITTYFRTAFEVGEIPEKLQLGLVADDGAAVYLNGTEVARDNLPTGVLTNTTRASTGRSGGDENAIRPFTLPVSALHAGTNTVTVELHQDSGSGSDASFDADLTGQMAASVPDPGTTPVQTVLMANGASWQWRYAAAAPDAAWALQSFDASTWNTGSAMLGWGNAAVATNIDTFATTAERPRAAYFRRTFDVVDRSKVTRLTLRTYADDGVAVYVNGQEVARRNLPAGPLTINTYATTAPRTAAAQATPLAIEVPPSLLMTGQNVIAVETHLNYRATPDLTFQLSADITAYP
jgi:hypothetical protein